jgi:hypothetical protein
MIKMFKIFEYNKIEVDRILDKINKDGLDSLSDIEKQTLQNNGEIPTQKHFESGDIIFDLNFLESFDDSEVIHGTLTYNNKKYDGYFQIYKSGQYLYDFENFEPDDDDWYGLDDLIEEIETIFI